METTKRSSSENMRFESNTLRIRLRRKVWYTDIDGPIQVGECDKHNYVLGVEAGARQRDVWPVIRASNRSISTSGRHHDGCGIPDAMNMQENPRWRLVHIAAVQAAYDKKGWKRKIQICGRRIVWLRRLSWIQNAALFNDKAEQIPQIQEQAVYLQRLSNTASVY